MNGMQHIVRTSICLGSLLTGLAGAGAEPSASTLEWPITEVRLGTTKHPCLFLNQAEVEKVRALVQVEGTYQQKRFQQVKKEVDAWFAKPVSIPAQGAGGSLRQYCPEDGARLQFNEPPAAHVCPKCGKEYRGEPWDGYWRYLTHSRCGRILNCLGLAYAITGEDRYAAEAARIMVHYAGIYPALPVANCAKLTCEALTEAYFALDVANAYDLVYNSAAFKAEDKKRVETNLLRSMAEVFQYGQWGWVDRVQGGLSNFNAGLCNGLGAIGFVLGDEALVEFTINGPRGYNRLLAQGVGEDGLWWEGSTAYHHQMVQEFMRFAEMAWHSGIDLFTNNNLKKTVLLQSRIAFPDGTLPGINDGEFVVGMFRSPAELFYSRTGDRDMLRLLVPGKIDGPGSWVLSGWGLWMTPDWPATPEPAVARESVNSAPNFAILRSDNTPENQIYLLMDYGPHGGTHGHSDKLQLVLWANGRLEAPDPGTFDYQSSLWGEWYKNSLGHNTIMVDGKPLWPGQGRLNLFRTSPRAKIMDASTVSDALSDDVDFSIYPFSIPRTRRVVALLDESFVIDIFRVAQVKTVDWVYHNFGDFQPATAMEPLSGALSEQGHGYQHIRNVRQASAAEQFSAVWSRENQGVKLTTMSDGLTLFAGDGPSPSGRGKGLDDKPMTLLIARATGNANFQSVIEPFRGAPAITNVKRLEVRPALPNLAAGNEMGIGIEVNKPDGRHTFMLGYTWWGLKTYGDFQFDGHMAFVSRQSGAGGAIEPQPGYVYMVDGSQLAAAGFAIRTGKLTTLWLQKGAEGGFTLEHQGQAPATIEIQGPNWTGATKVSQLDQAGQPAQEVPSTLRDGTLRWLAAADTRYQIR